jgi:hypothetical protein
MYTIKDILLAISGAGIVITSPSPVLTKRASWVAAFYRAVKPPIYVLNHPPNSTRRIIASNMSPLEESSVRAKEPADQSMVLLA